MSNTDMNDTIDRDEIREEFWESIADSPFVMLALDNERKHSIPMRAQLDKDVDELPDAYDTIVGERGVMLSGGQRQRAALARALAVRPRILILDDVLSAVDAETEAGIQRELGRVFAGRTVVVVSSRVSAVRNADQIIVLDAGRIVERGTHGALMARNGLYTRLASEQAAEEARRAAALQSEATP